MDGGREKKCEKLCVEWQVNKGCEERKPQMTRKVCNGRLETKDHKGRQMRKNDQGCEVQ